MKIDITLRNAQFVKEIDEKRFMKHLQDFLDETMWFCEVEYNRSGIVIKGD